MTILAGDFNAKVGKRRHTGISCLERLPLEKTWIDFCSINHLFISNTSV